MRANRRVADTIGRPADEIVEHLRIQDLLTVGGRIYYETHINPLLHMQGQVQEIALDLRAASGVLPVLLNAVLKRDDAGEPLGIHATLLDATERRRYEREILAARDRAEEAARIAGELMSMVSHDMRTPLAAIMTALELLRSTGLRTDQARLVQMLTASSTNLLNLITDVLEMGRLESGRVSPARKPIDLVQLLNDLAEEHRLEADEKELELRITADAGIPRPVLGDSIKIGRVLGNLIGNAIKFTERGHVEVRVEVARRDAAHVMLALAVADTGIGIDREEQGRIFDDFTQGSQEISSRYGGTGLGLGICRRLLSLYDSKLCVESEPAVGSTFSFDLTLEVGAPATPE